MHIFFSQMSADELQMMGQGMIRVGENVIEQEFDAVAFQEWKIDVIAKDGERAFVFQCLIVEFMTNVVIEQMRIVAEGGEIEENFLLDR